MQTTQHLLDRMFAQADVWEKDSDQRYVFQRCYGMMSRNMAQAIATGRFTDAQWVERLMLRFADYYYDALTLYEQQHPDTPPVWQQVHDVALQKRLHIMQHLLLGINAHINYDLPLALYDGLHAEWPTLAEPERQIRKTDHETVNIIIAETIDAVQDEVIEPRSPVMALADRLMGRMDEWLLAQLITGWRTEVWRVTLDLLTAADPNQWENIRAAQEQKVLARGKELSRTRLMRISKARVP
ncbi:MAG: hypothetical protein KF734_22865 [Saprospiraceae bacterium]|nr:hypothetical protein [Saprospiraceae bacterium]